MNAAIMVHGLQLQRLAYLVLERIQPLPIHSPLEQRNDSKFSAFFLLSLCTLFQHAAFASSRDFTIAVTARLFPFHATLGFNTRFGCYAIDG